MEIELYTELNQIDGPGDDHTDLTSIQIIDHSVSESTKLTQNIIDEKQAFIEEKLNLQTDSAFTAQESKTRTVLSPELDMKPKLELETVNLKETSRISRRTKRSKGVFVKSITHLNIIVFIFMLLFGVLDGKVLSTDPSKVPQKFTTTGYNCHHPLSIRYIDKEQMCDPVTDELNSAYKKLGTTLHLARLVLLEPFIKPFGPN